MKKLFEAKDQKEFLILAHRYHWGKALDSFGLYWGLDHSVIHWMYKLGRDYNILQMDYNQFVRIISDKQKDYYDGHYHQRRYCGYRYSGSRYFQLYDIKYYRVSRRFIYSGQPKKNKPSKNAWREHKKMGKDKSLRYRYSWKKSLKHYSARKHRRLEREAIKSECYELLHSQSYKQSDNPWNWD